MSEQHTKKGDAIMIASPAWFLLKEAMASERSAATHFARTVITFEFAACQMVIDEWKLFCQRGAIKR